MNLDYCKEVLQDGCTYIPNLCSSWWINAFTVSLTVIDIECIVSLWYPKKSFFLKMSSICHILDLCMVLSLFKWIPNIPSGKQTVCYWKWWFIVDLSINNGDFPLFFVHVYQRVIKTKTWSTQPMVLQDLPLMQLWFFIPFWKDWPVSVAGKNNPFWLNPSSLRWWNRNLCKSSKD